MTNVWRMGKRRKRERIGCMRYLPHSAQWCLIFKG